MAILPSEPQKRQAVLLGLLAIGAAGYVSHQMLHTPRAARVAELDSRLESLQLQNQGARSISHGAGVADVERQLASYREQLIAVEGLVPLSEEVPDLLDAISIEAQRTGIELTRLQPTGAIDEQFYTRRTYDLSVVGAYHDIAYFLSRIGSLPRIITPIGLNLTVREEDERGAAKLEARFSIETYVIPLTGPTLEETHAR